MTRPNPTKPQTGQCTSYIAIPRINDQSPETFERCTQQGVRRYDNSLDSGIHCPTCWETRVYECRQRSW